MSDMGSKASSAAGRAGRSRGVKTLARGGMVVSGVLHLLMGWLALQLAWTGSDENADTSGALGALAQNPLGSALLWVGVVGFVALAIWQVAEAVTGREASDKVKAAAKAIVYLALAWSTFGFAQGGGSDSAEQSSDFTATLMEQPFGVVLVIVLGVAVIAVGGYHVYKGVKKKFLDDLVGHPGRFVERAGVIGYAAKGVAFVVVGALFVTAAVTNDPEEATGLDGALRSLLELPFGKVLLTVVALGLVAFGVYSFGRAKHAKL